LGRDLVLMLEGLVANASHPQVYLIVLKVLQTNFAQQRGSIRVFDNERLQLLFGILDT